MARATTLNEHVQATICRGVERLLSVKDSCHLAGVCYRSAYDWMKRGQREESGIYHDFFLAITAAKAAAKSEMVEAIRTASPEDWKAAAWLLERRFPKDFGKLTKQEVSGPGGKPLEVKTTKGLSPELAGFLRKQVLGIGQDEPDAEDET